MQFTLVYSEPVPVWSTTVDIADEYRFCPPPVTARALREEFEALRGCFAYRGVNHARLETILATGIDVEPTTAPIFVSDFAKAWLYGGWPRVIMALDGRQLDYT